MSTTDPSEANSMQQRLLEFRLLIHDALRLNSRLCEYLEKRVSQLEARKVQRQQQERTADESQSRHTSFNPRTTGYYSSVDPTGSPRKPSRFTDENNPEAAYQPFRILPNPTNIKNIPTPNKNSTYTSTGIRPSSQPQPLTSTPYHYHLDSFRSPTNKPGEKCDNRQSNGPVVTGCQRISCPNCKSALLIEFTIKS